MVNIKIVNFQIGFVYLLSNGKTEYFPVLKVSDANREYVSFHEMLTKYVNGFMVTIGHEIHIPVIITT